MSSASAAETAPEDEAEHGLPAPDETLLRLRQSIVGGRHWFDALLEAIGDWRLPEETLRGRRYRYLVGGEAFDWLLLAERLIEEIRDVVPARETEALLFEGRWPIDLEDDEFAERLGPAKFSAHLNYLYGVLVEEALQLFVEEEIHKEHHNRPWGSDRRDHEGGMYRRVYGLSFRELAALHYEQTGTMIGDEIDYPDFKAFTYWLFKLRLKRQDKARVASDTRKGLAQLTRMELAVSERRRGAILGEADFVQRYAQEKPVKASVTVHTAAAR
jgi:hypothetical protein